jgi:hypothetical protein
LVAQPAQNIRLGKFDASLNFGFGDRRQLQGVWEQANSKCVSFILSTRLLARSLTWCAAG